MPMHGLTRSARRHYEGRPLVVFRCMSFHRHLRLIQMTDRSRCVEPSQNKLFIFLPAPEFPPSGMSDVGQQKRAFLDFIDQAGYLSTIQRALSRGDSRLCLNLDDLRGYDPEVTSPL